MSISHQYIPCRATYVRQEKWDSVMAWIRTRKLKSGTRYTATIRLKGHRPVSATFGRKADAQDWAAITESQIKRGAFIDKLDSSMSFSNAVDKYLAQISPKKAANTHRREKQLASQLLKGFNGRNDLHSITSLDVADYRDLRLKDVSNTTVRLELSLLSDIFNRAIQDWGLLIDNPVKKIKRPSPAPGRVRFCTEEEAGRLLAACKESQNQLLYPFILLLMHTGMRPSEAAGLRWDQVDLAQRFVLLEKTKTAPFRRVPITTPTADALKNLELQENGLIFLPDEKRLIKSDYFRKAFETARKRAGLNDLRMYDLRHTAASHLLMAGVDLRTLADILGHRTMQMVMRYSHLLDDHKQEAVDRIAGLGLQKKEKMEKQRMRRCLILYMIFSLPLNYQNTF